jgi:hypothetical protein
MYSWQEMQTGRWSDHAWTTAKHGECTIDPYLVWADLTNFADLGRELTRKSWIPVILRLTGRVDGLLEEAANRASVSEYIRIAPMYRPDPRSALAEARFCTAAVRCDLFWALGDDQALKSKIEQLQLGLPIREVEEPRFHTPREAPVEARRDIGADHEAPVVVGIIDDGFAFAHGRFRKPGSDATRIEAFWDQGEGWSAPNRARSGGEAEAQPRGDEQTPLREVPYGTQLSKAEINALIQQSTHAGIVDEDEVYRRCGYRGVELRGSHGTHVMDLACGSGPEEGKAKARLPRIMCVALPRPTTGDTSGLSLAIYALDGLRYILDCADRRAPGAKVVVNLSYGAIAGPHDGTSMLEAAIDELIRLRDGKLEVVIAAGNNHLSRCHAQFALGPGGAQTLQWRILPDDATPSFLEIWLPPPQRPDDPPPKVAVGLTPPGSETSDAIKWVEAGQAREIADGDSVIATVIHLATGGRRRMILVTVAPTTTLHPSRRTAPAGAWRVDIRNDSGRKLDVDAWIQRDDNVRGFRRRGRQSHFEDPEYERLDGNGRPVEEDQPKSRVQRAGTLNSIGTGARTILVGGYRGSDGAPAPYSARGPAAARGGLRPNPDAMAVSERSITRHGVLAAGSRTGSLVAMNGTSVAAPQLTRWIAEQMVAGAPAGAEAVRARAMRDDPDAPEGVRPTPDGSLPDVKPKPVRARGGAGRIRSTQRGEDGPDTFRPFAKR